MTANDLQTLSKSIYSGYVRSSEFSEWASASAGKKTIKDERSRKLQTAEKPENQVPQMVEAFRPLIEECIRVNEVLPYLHFLGISVFVIVYSESKNVDLKHRHYISSFQNSSLISNLSLCCS